MVKFGVELQHSLKLSLDPQKTSKKHKKTRSHQVFHENGTTQLPAGSDVFDSHTLLGELLGRDETR
jgi:hypothetical protein